MVAVKWCLGLLLCCLIGTGIVWVTLEHTVAAQSTVPLSSEPIVVGLFPSPPFVIAGDEGWDGIGLHLWRNAAEELAIDYDFLTIRPEETVSALRDNKVDVVIGAVANAEAEESIDFTHAYFVSSLGTAEPAARTIWEIAGAFFSPRFWYVALWLVVAFLIVGMLAWLFERQANEEQFGQGTLRGIWSGFWWAGVTMSTIGYGDKVPRTVGGRVVALLWMIVAMGVTAILTATLTSILTLNTNISGTQFPGSLRQMTVGATSSTQSAAFLEEERIQFQPYDTPQAGMDAVYRGEVEIYVDDVAVLRFVNNEMFKGALRVNGTQINPQRHVFAVTSDSSLREPLNRYILAHTQEPAWRSLVERYIP